MLVLNSNVASSVGLLGLVRAALESDGLVPFLLPHSVRAESDVLVCLVFWFGEQRQLVFGLDVLLLISAVVFLLEGGKGFEGSEDVIFVLWMEK